MFRISTNAADFMMNHRATINDVLNPLVPSQRPMIKQFDLVEQRSEGIKSASSLAGCALNPTSAINKESSSAAELLFLVTEITKKVHLHFGHYASP